MVDPPTEMHVVHHHRPEPPTISYNEMRHHVEFVLDAQGRTWEVQPGPKIARLVSHEGVVPRLVHRNVPGFRTDVVVPTGMQWFCDACTNLNLSGRSFCAYCGSNRTLDVTPPPKPHNCNPLPRTDASA
jgi:hypothetical protein